MRLCSTLNCIQIDRYIRRQMHKNSADHLCFLTGLTRSLVSSYSGQNRPTKHALLRLSRKIPEKNRGSPNQALLSKKLRFPKLNCLQTLPTVYNSLKKKVINNMFNMQCLSLCYDTLCRVLRVGSLLKAHSARKHFLPNFMKLLVFYLVTEQIKCHFRNLHLHV